MIVPRVKIVVLLGGAAKGTVALSKDGLEQGDNASSPSSSTAAAVEFHWFRFPREIIVLAMRWYLRYGLSYRDVKELLAERGVDGSVTCTGGRSGTLHC